MTKLTPPVSVSTRFERLVGRIQMQRTVTGSTIARSCAEVKRYARTFKLGLPPNAWQTLSVWEKLGRFDVNLKLRKLKLVRLWQSQFSSIVRAMVSQLRKQLWKEVSLLRDGKKTGSGSRRANELRCFLPPHLRGLKEYRHYVNAPEFWGFAGLTGKARRAYLDLKNGQLPALAVEVWFR